MNRYVAMCVLAAVVAVTGCGGGGEGDGFDEDAVRAAIAAANPDAEADAVDDLVDLVRDACDGSDTGDFTLAMMIDEGSDMTYVEAGCPDRVAAIADL